jgi:hypothetical protein
VLDKEVVISAFVLEVALLKGRCVVVVVGVVVALVVVHSDVHRQRTLRTAVSALLLRTVAMACQVLPYSFLSFDLRPVRIPALAKW